MFERRGFPEVPPGLWAAQLDAHMALPRRMDLIRHSEKTGAKSDPHLNPPGAKRAAALLNLAARGAY